jgi:cellulose synthase/poly-beta-1,6-N-acetylglucosamine synthase-like glycosyltransferase
MNFIDGVFFIYIFIGLYMFFLLLTLYAINREKIYDSPKGKPEPVSIVVPCYNDEEFIGKTIEALLDLNYPKDMLEIIVVDDKSKDNSAEVVRRYARKHKNVRLIVNKRNSGGAAEPRNTGVRAAKYKYVAVTDSDSMPERDALIKMIGFLQQDKNVGAVTCSILTKKPKTFWQRMQEMEYVTIAFTRRLLDFVDSVYVTPGPFALYRKKELIEIGLFDPTNMTEDIEIVWRYLSKGYKARMAIEARAYSATPETFKGWWKQRLRWNIGGKQTLWRYRKFAFRHNMLGYFIIPFFSASLFLGLFGLGIFAYLGARRVLVAYLSTKYSIYASTALISMQELSFAPSVLNYFGAILGLLGIAFSIFGFIMMRERHYRKVFNFIFYILVYLSIYPVILVHSSYKMIRGTYSW